MNMAIALSPTLFSTVCSLYAGSVLSGLFLKAIGGFFFNDDQVAPIAGATGAWSDH